MKKLPWFIRLLVMFACSLGMSHRLFAQQENFRSSQNISARRQVAPVHSDKRYYHKSQRRVYVQFSAGPAAFSPSGAFYDGLDSNVGVAFSARLYQTNAEGGTQGFFGGISYQRAALKYSEIYGFNIYQPQLAGSVGASVLALEAGRAHPIDKNGSHLYVIAGLASLTHKGDSPSSDGSVLRYQEGSRLGLRVKAGFAVFLSRNLGLDLGLGFDVMQTRVTYTDLNNYSETKNAGVLMTAGMGLSYRL